MRGIEKLHPGAQTKANLLIALCGDVGLPLSITDTLRTQAEQDTLYAQGRNGNTAPVVTNCRGVDYASAHQWGVAFDFCKAVKGQEYSDMDFFNRVGKIAKSIGLIWGGDFKGFIDRPHIEMFGYPIEVLKEKYGTPENFFKTWVDENVHDTVKHLIADGVVANGEYWLGLLTGRSQFNPEYVKTVFDRYHEKLIS